MKKVDALARGCNYDTPPSVQCSMFTLSFFLILGMKNDRVRDGQIPGVFSVKYYNTEVIISYVDKRCNR